MYCNNSFTEIFEWTMDELLGKRVPFVPEECLDETMAAVKRMLSGEPTIGFNTRRLTKDGRVLDITLSANIFSIPDEEFNGSVIVLRDTTESLAIQTQLAHAQKMDSIGQLAAGIAHEINTPSQFIDNNIGFLEDANLDITAIADSVLDIARLVPQDIRQKLEKAFSSHDWEYLSKEIPQAIEQAREGVSRISAIVSAMKHFSDPGPKDISANSINQIIKDTVTVATNEWKYIAKVEMQLDQSIPMVPCFPNELGQVVLNLLLNSVDAIKEKIGKSAGPDEKGLISISTQFINGKSVAIVITDDGCGIPESCQKKVLEPFFTTKEVGQGTGQRLSISHRLITGRHNGEISFKSRAGKGTAFTITLPTIR